MGVVPPQISVCLSELSRAQGGLWMLWAMHIHLKKNVILYMTHRWTLFSSECSAYLHLKGRAEEY